MGKFTYKIKNVLGTNNHRGSPVQCQGRPFLSLQGQAPLGTELGTTVNAWKMGLKINMKTGINSKLGFHSNIPW